MLRPRFHQFGLSIKQMLLPSAVPTIFPFGKKAKTQLKKRGAFEKRERIRVLNTTLLEPKSMIVEQEKPQPGCSHWEEESFVEVHVSKVHDVACQTEPLSLTMTQSTQTCSTCTFTDTGIQATAESPQICSTDVLHKDLVEPVDEESSEEEAEETMSQESPGYIPSESSSSDSPEKRGPSVKRRGRRPHSACTRHQSIDVPPHEETKYIVFESQLVKLFQKCHQCNSRQVTNTKRRIGTYVSISQHCRKCELQHPKWESQPRFGAVPAGNILLSSAILFAGASPTQVLRLLNSIGVATQSTRSFFLHQQRYLLPAVEKVWGAHLHKIQQELYSADEPLTIGGDGRADSPGHSAKYGSYTGIELRINKIVDIQLVQCNEVNGSYHMEMEGFKRMMDTLKLANLSVGKLVTDRHHSMAKYIRESEPTIIHMYDVWHIAKGIKKKVAALAKKKGYEKVAEWKRSINNHVYWCASSTTDPDGDLRIAKWKSLSNHIVGVHHGHSDLFPVCDHRQIRRRKKKWPTPGTEETVKLNAILESPSLVKDIGMMSPTTQTSSVESFHSLINQFAPKMKAYSYEGMQCRLHIAGLHYNENSERAQDITSQGVKMFHLSKPKYKPGEAAVKPLKESATFEYARTLFSEVVQRCRFGVPDFFKSPAPPTMTKRYKYPSKEDLIARHRSRFNLPT